MARHKEFNREEVLDKAIDVFWTRGFEATSVQDLVDGMGINRGSLYDTFGDKHQLFLEALDRYEKAFHTKILRFLEEPVSPRNAIERVFDTVIRECACDSGRRGCFLTNTAVELAAQDDDTASRVKANFSRMESAFAKAVFMAKEKGEINTPHDTKAMARFLTSSLQGLRVMSKAWPSRAVLRDVARVTLSTLG
jgi:TetR/AcrR family transcriptional repressor of nem operon